MSELQRSFAKAKLAGLPFEPPLPVNDLIEDEEDESTDGLRPLPESHQDDDSSSASSASSASSTGTIRPSPSKHLFARPKGYAPSRKALDPLPWTDYFEQELYLNKSFPHEKITYHAYLLAPIDKGPMLVTHHGAGSSGLSFAAFTCEIRKLLPRCGVLSLDTRGHGETVVEAKDGGSRTTTLHFNLQTLSEDLFNVITLTQEQCRWPSLPDTILIGHSLGGAVVTDLAVSGKLGKNLLGYAVLDVVEGSAMDALQSMQQYLSKRPNSFDSIPAAIDWHLRSRTIRSQTSARVSVPSLLRPTMTQGQTSHDGASRYSWRTDLSETEPYWSEWFTGLSSKFLRGKGGKLLILAGTDRLDKELMIGQMQGKYQLQVFPEAGHFVHEDCPEKTATIVADFVRRNDRSGLVLPPKVGATLEKQPKQ